MCTGWCWSHLSGKAWRRSRHHTFISKLWWWMGYIRKYKRLWMVRLAMHVTNLAFWSSSGLSGWIPPRFLGTSWLTTAMSSAARRRWQDCPPFVNIIQITSRTHAQLRADIELNVLKEEWSGEGVKKRKPFCEKYTTKGWKLVRFVGRVLHQRYMVRHRMPDKSLKYIKITQNGWCWLLVLFLV